MLIQRFDYKFMYVYIYCIYNNINDNIRVLSIDSNKIHK